MRTIQGIVVSTKMDKTIAVAVVTEKSHPKYHKKYKTTKKFYAHDEAGTCKEGDEVTIVEIRPLSKLKRWAVEGDPMLAKVAAPAAKKPAAKKPAAKKPAAKKATTTTTKKPAAKKPTAAAKKPAAKKPAAKKTDK